MTTNHAARYIIIDDHPFFRDGVRNFLAIHSPYECIGEFPETRYLLNSDHTLLPDFILLDINIPNLEGKMSCGLLKKKYTACKIIALTQYADLGDTLKSFHFDGYVEKDNTEGLLDAIDTVLKGAAYFVKNEKKKSATPFEDDFLKIHNDVSKREVEIMRYVEKGYSSAEIAQKLHISENTVKTHRRNFKQKIGKKGPEMKELLRRSGLAD